MTEEELEFCPDCLVASVGSDIVAATMGAFLMDKDIARARRDGVVSLRMHSPAVRRHMKEILRHNGRCLPSPGYSPVHSLGVRPNRLKAMRVVEYVRDGWAGWCYVDERWLPGIHAVLHDRHLKLPT